MIVKNERLKLKKIKKTLKKIAYMIVKNARLTLGKIKKDLK